MPVRRICERQAGSALRRDPVVGPHRIPDITYREVTDRMEPGYSQQSMRSRS